MREILGKKSTDCEAPMTCEPKLALNSSEEGHSFWGRSEQGRK